MKEEKILITILFIGMAMTIIASSDYNKRIIALEKENIMIKSNLNIINDTLIQKGKVEWREK